MTMAELETAVREKARVIAVVFDNERYGTIRMHQDRRGTGAGLGTDLGPIDFVGIARACGARGTRVETDAALEPALRQALAADRPSVLHLGARSQLGFAGPARDVSGADPAAETSYRALLAVPWLPRILAAMIIARIAQSMVAIAIVLFTLSEYGSPALTGIVTLAATLPGLLVSPDRGRPARPPREDAARSTRLPRRDDRAGRHRRPVVARRRSLRGC